MLFCVEEEAPLFLMSGPFHLDGVMQANFLMRFHWESLRNKNHRIRCPIRQNCLVMIRISEET